MDVIRRTLISADSYFEHLTCAWQKVPLWLPWPWHLVAALWTQPSGSECSEFGGRFLKEEPQSWSPASLSMVLLLYLIPASQTWCPLFPKVLLTKIRVLPVSCGPPKLVTVLELSDVPYAGGHWFSEMSLFASFSLILFVCFSVCNSE